MKKEIIDNCTLYLGDCLDVMQILPAKSIDLRGLKQKLNKEVYFKEVKER